MGKTYDAIDEPLRRFIAAQHIFFIATAPGGSDGHINLSPKGLDSFRVLDSRTVAYLDLTGSGVETIAHLRDNGRITIAFCAFEGPPKILRLYGRGEALLRDHPEFPAVAALFPRFAGTRSVIRVAVERISDSCGYGVPSYQYEGERRQLVDWADHRGADGLEAYRQERNATSIDGLPGFGAPAVTSAPAPRRS